MKTQLQDIFLPRKPLRATLVLLVVLLLVGLRSGPCAKAEGTQGIDWRSVAELRPDLKVLVLVESKQPLSLQDLALLADIGLTPADRDAGLVIGQNRAVFKTLLGNWMSRCPLPEPLKGRLISRFHVNGVYRVAFKVVAKAYDGPLNVELTEPRDGFGKKLLACEHVVRPEAVVSTHDDSAGNRWLSAEFSRVRTGDTVKIYMGFTYMVDVAEVLKHDLQLAKDPTDDDIPPEVVPYLGSGYKIDPKLPRAQAWAARTGTTRPNARQEFKRLAKFLLDTVTYNTRKKAEYFGGLAVYTDLDHMYQAPRETIQRGTGCCPDTVLLECSFLRARGIPCRTAGRFGHFFSEVYVPGSGWMSTSVTPTGIPLIVSPSPDHVPYQMWEPNISLRTSRLEARIRISPLEDQ